MNAVQNMLHHAIETASGRDLLARLEAQRALETMPDTSPYATEEPAPRGLDVLQGDRPYAWLSVDYADRQPATYAGITVDYSGPTGQDRRWRFMSGEFSQDMTRARRFVHGLACDSGVSSRIAHYVIDRNNTGWTPTEDRPVGMSPELRTLAGLDAS